MLGNDGFAMKVHRIGGVPGEVARKAVSAAGGRVDKRDRVWAVFDRDSHPDFDEAMASCDAHGVEVARSNPCFELWLILHHTDYDRPADSRNLKAEFAALDVTCDDPVGSVEDAERRAAEQLDRRSEEGAPYGNPSTTVGTLTRALREGTVPAGGGPR